MKQSAVGLANICILSTAVLMSVSSSFSLYVGQKDLIKTRYPEEVNIISYDTGTMDLEKLLQFINSSAQNFQIEMDKPNYYHYMTIRMKKSGDSFVKNSDENQITEEYMKYFTIIPLSDYNQLGNWNVSLKDDEVLIIYYKQISEGYDEKERFEILQKVGMNHSEIKRSIQSQILIVFFMPLVMAVIHVAIAFHVMTKILAILNLVNVQLFMIGALCTVVVFAVIYVFVYFMTAQVYYRIVKYIIRGFFLHKQQFFVYFANIPLNKFVSVHILFCGIIINRKYKACRIALVVCEGESA